MGKKKLLKKINEIQQSTNTTNEIQTKIQNLITLHCKTENEKLDIINQNYEIMFKKRGLGGIVPVHNSILIFHIFENQNL